MAQTKRSYYAIIPATVRYDEKLIPSAKLLYGEITALCNEKGYCWASNDYFANLYGVSKGTIQRWLKSLEEQNYIKRTVTRKEGSNEIDTRYIHLCGDPHIENDTTPHLENDQDNNTSFNNTTNNTYKDEVAVSKNKYGEFNNVLLTKQELEKLKEKYPNDYLQRIERVSGYVASTGKAYKSHYATIISWARNENRKTKQDGRLNNLLE